MQVWPKLPKNLFAYQPNWNSILFNAIQNLSLCIAGMQARVWKIVTLPWKTKSESKSKVSRGLQRNKEPLSYFLHSSHKCHRSSFFSTRSLCNHLPSPCCNLWWVLQISKGCCSTPMSSPQGWFLLQLLLLAPFVLLQDWQLLLWSFKSFSTFSCCHWFNTKVCCSFTDWRKMTTRNARRLS